MLSEVRALSLSLTQKNSIMKKKKVAVLATDGFEEVELTSPKQAMEKAGFEVQVLAPESGKIKAWNDGNWSDEYKVDAVVDEISAQDYDGLFLPGGVINPDRSEERRVGKECRSRWSR